MEGAYFLLPDEALCPKQVCPVIPTEGILAVARRGTLLKRIYPVIPTKPEGRRGICFIGSDEGDRDKQIPRFA
jgi:hypothetical protein